MTERHKNSEGDDATDEKETKRQINCLTVSEERSEDSPARLAERTLAIFSEQGIFFFLAAVRYSSKNF